MRNFPRRFCGFARRRERQDFHQPGFRGENQLRFSRRKLRRGPDAFGAEALSSEPTNELPSRFSGFGARRDLRVLSQNGFAGLRPAGDAGARRHRELLPASHRQDRSLQPG
jgi:hypothetical protein